MKNILFIPAAGNGVRFKELGRLYPKCVLPVRGVPIIQRIVRAFDGVFESIIIGARDKQAKEQIEAALCSAHAFVTPCEVTVVDTQDRVPSPVTSLFSMLSGKLVNAAEDFGVAVALSDAIPNAEVVKLYLQHRDFWVVQERSDHERWCMVRENTFGLQFFDKQSTPPPTYLAASGYYHYSSAFDLYDAVGPLDSYSREIQFSELAAIYQAEYFKNLKAVTISSGSSEDFGTLEDFMRNGGVLRTRSYNTLKETTRGSVVKTSADENKIALEARWYRKRPLHLKQFVPALYAHARGMLEIEKIETTNLRDLALYLDRSYETWLEVFTEVHRYFALSECSVFNLRRNYFWDTILEKTKFRVATTDMKACRLSKTFVDVWLLDFKDALLQAPIKMSYYHGDMHFANMFYDLQRKKLKLVDPRGEELGSPLYDIAKLLHSVRGRYDYIDADLYSQSAENGTVEFFDADHTNIERAFNDVFKLTEREWRLVNKLVESLFLTMIPLHEDRPDHQIIFAREFVRLASQAS